MTISNPKSVFGISDGSDMEQEQSAQNSLSSAEQLKLRGHFEEQRARAKVSTSDKLLPQAKERAQNSKDQVREFDNLLFENNESGSKDGADGEELVVADYVSKRYIKNPNMTSTEDEKLLTALHKAASKHSMDPERLLHAFVGEDDEFEVLVRKKRLPKIMISIFPEPEITEKFLQASGRQQTTDWLVDRLKARRRRGDLGFEPIKLSKSKIAQEERTRFALQIPVPVMDWLTEKAKPYEGRGS